MKYTILLISALTLINSAQAETEIQYFSGSIQVSSLDGKTKHGPPYDSLVRRTVDAVNGTIIECVLQQGRMFYTTMTRTAEPLDFTARDSEQSFTGILSFDDYDLNAWSYDIQVTKPNRGHLTGKLPQYGAVINRASKTMSIKKIWEGEVLITEDYNETDSAGYAQKLKENKAANPALIIPSECN